VAVGDSPRVTVYTAAPPVKADYAFTHEDRLPTEAQHEWMECLHADIETGRDGGSFATAFSPSSRLCAVGSQDGSVAVFDTRCAESPDVDPIILEMKSSRPGTSSGAIRSVHFSPGPWDLLVWAEQSGRIGVADLREACRKRQVVDIVIRPDIAEHADVTQALSADDLIDPRLLHNIPGLSMPPTYENWGGRRSDRDRILGMAEFAAELESRETSEDNGISLRPAQTSPWADPTPSDSEPPTWTTPVTSASREEPNPAADIEPFTMLYLRANGTWRPRRSGNTNDVIEPTVRLPVVRSSTVDRSPASHAEGIRRFRERNQRREERDRNRASSISALARNRLPQISQPPGDMLDPQSSTNSDARWDTAEPAPQLQSRRNGQSLPEPPIGLDLTPGTGDSSSSASSSLLGTTDALGRGPGVRVQPYPGVPPVPSTSLGGEGGRTQTSTDAWRTIEAAMAAGRISAAGPGNSSAATPRNTDTRAGLRDRAREHMERLIRERQILLSQREIVHNSVAAPAGSPSRTYGLPEDFWMDDENEESSTLDITREPETASRRTATELERRGQEILSLWNSRMNEVDRLPRVAPDDSRGDASPSIPDLAREMEVEASLLIPRMTSLRTLELEREDLERQREELREQYGSIARGRVPRDPLGVSRAATGPATAGRGPTGASTLWNRATAMEAELAEGRFEGTGTIGLGMARRRHGQIAAQARRGGGAGSAGGSDEGINGCSFSSDGRRL
jgi:WD40 repeat protein